MDTKGFELGDRVRVKRIRIRNGGASGGVTGTIVGLPGTARGCPPYMYVVSLADGTIHGYAPELLEPNE